MTAYRLTFDAARCDGFGMCSLLFPERVSLDLWGFAQVDREPLISSADLRRAGRAVRCCPRRALALVPSADRQESVPHSAGS